MSPGWRLPQLMEVFLSCCETNFGDSQITDDPLTLSTGFLCAGASSVINTLWSVDDLATALFSIFYYEFRQLRYNRAQSVRKAQAKLRTLSRQEFKNQYEQELNNMLSVKKQQAETQRKAVKELKPHKDTPAYEEWEKKYKQSAEVVKKIGDSQKRLAYLCKLALPFEHLMYWAGFCCQGMK